MEKPASLKKGRLMPPEHTLGPHFDRFGHYPKGTVLPETQVQVSPPRKVADFPRRWFPERLLNHLEHNQKIASCCRHPENHIVEGRKTHPKEVVSDVYIFTCTCGRKHTIMCVGFGDERPEWE